MKRFFPASLALLAALNFVTASGFAEDKKKDPDEIGNRDVSKGVNFYSLEKEIALGKQLANEVERSAKIVDDPVIAEYVNRVGQNLVRNSDAKVPFTIKVIDSEDVNAFALPGGFFFVNSGLILKADNEAELAGVMAHEIAHVAARHGTRQATRGEIANLATIPLIFMGVMAHEIAHVAARHGTRQATRGEIANLATIPLIFMGGWAGYGIRQAASILVPVGFLKFSRAFESEADMLGLEYMYKTGYDPTAFVDFFEKIETLEKRKPGTMAKVFSTHPPTDSRIQDAQKNIQRILKAKPEYVLNTSEFNDVKARLLAMHNHRKIDDKDLNKPKLRRAPGSGTGPVDADEDGKKPKGDEDERPTLKRRPSSDSE